MGNFETIRHGDKNVDGTLSERGGEQAREKAVELYERIQNAPLGSIIYLTPSNVGRAVETRNEIETELQELCAEDPSVEFVPINTLKERPEIKSNFTKKFVVTEVQPQSIIGFKADTDYVPAWKEYGKKFSGNEYFTMLAWVAKPEELESVKGELHEAFPETDTDSIRPSDFVRTPEEEAIRYLRLSARMREITESHFPGHEYVNIQVGHNTADFSVLALMGKDISAENLKTYLHGRSRNFLESATFENKDGKIIVRYRENETEQEKDLGEIIKELEQKSEERKLAWSGTNK